MPPRDTRNSMAGTGVDNNHRVIRKGKAYIVGGKRKNEPRTAEIVRAKLEYAEKARKALQLRASGLTYGQIATAVGYKSAGHAHEIIKKALDELMIEPGEELVRINLLRLEQMFGMIYNDLLKSTNVDERLRITPVLLNILREEHKLTGVQDVLAGTSPTAQINAQINVDARHVTTGSGRGAVLLIDGEPPEYMKNLEIASGHKAPDLNFKNMLDDSDIIEAEVVDSVPEKESETPQ